MQPTGMTVLCGERKALKVLFNTVINVQWKQGFKDQLSNTLHMAGW